MIEKKRLSEKPLVHETAQVSDSVLGRYNDGLWMR